MLRQSKTGGLLGYIMNSNIQKHILYIYICIYIYTYMYTICLYNKDDDAAIPNSLEPRLHTTCHTWLGQYTQGN